MFMNNQNQMNNNNFNQMNMNNFNQMNMNNPNQMNMNNFNQMNMNNFNQMNMNNPNQINMNNQMNINNFNQMNMNDLNMMNQLNLNMMNFMNNYMKLYQLYNNNGNNNNKNQGKMGITNNSNNSEGKKGILPKDKQTITFTAFPQYNGLRCNIIFQTPAGHKVIMRAPINAKMGDLLLQYISVVGLGPNVLSKGIYFLFNGKKLKKEQDFNKTAQDIGISTASTIVVIDTENLIGA